MLTRPPQRLHSDERGIALIVVMAMLLVLGTIAAAVFANSLQIKNATTTERAGKQAYAAALSGLRSAIYLLNATAPADGSCPPLPGQTTPQSANVTSRVCGPYESDDVSNVGGLTKQPLVGQRFTYWITPALDSSTDTCTGRPPLVTTPGTGTTVRNRCITAVGQSVRGSVVTSTRRVQARVSSTNAQFPVPGIFGAACLSLGVSPQAVGCNSGQGASNSDYYGTIGSNGPVDVQLKTWSYDPTNPPVGAPFAPATLYLGYTSPNTPTLPTYSIKVQQIPTGTPAPTGCGAGLTFCNNSLPPLPYNSSATGPYQNPVHQFGTWYQPLRMGSLFASPPNMVNPGNSLPSGCTSTDVSVCNNNSLITTASSNPLGCATLSSNRTLTLSNNCTLSLQNGTYDFCDITLGRTSAVMPVDTTSNAEIRVFLDNKNRTVAGNPACANATAGTINWPNSSQFPRWMTNNATAVTAAGCLTAFDGDTWTALAGQLYVYGAGDPADATTNYPPNLNSRLDIIGVNWNGAIIATNSTLNLTDSNTCVHGAIAAGALNVANNAGFRWDPNVSRVFLTTLSTTYFRTAFATCTAAGFRFTSVLTPPTYPTYPSDGC